ncbi:BTB/POZ domain-containing protein 1 isoform X2 [Halyomorpha halys]|uniref:BTB/POZ domain-containing protein 1 isoform X2 n=1 Tax=Halyomorpha halys TaxID=286706 RepID=UPI0034D24368
MALLINDWQTRSQTLAQKCCYLFEKKLLSDCEFHVENEKIQCHKLILTMSSPVFQAMFFNGYSEESAPIIITDIKSDIFLQMIHFIYEMPIYIQSYINACDLYYAAKKYLLTFLEKDCINYLLDHLNHSNALYLYEFSKFHDEIKLRKQCILEIQLHTTEVLRSVHASNMSEDTISSILDLHTLNVPSELTLFKMVEEWILSTIDMKDLSSTQWKGKFYGILKKIRFLSLTTNEFAESILPTKLLTDKEKLDILLRIVKVSETPMGNGLCELRQKRRPVNIKSTKDVSEVRCDGSEWLTSLFNVSSPMDLIGIEIKMQIREEGGQYVENIMVKVAEAQSKFHFAEGNIYGPVHYNSKAQILFNTVAKLKPGKDYALHVFLCKPGMYPIGRHNKSISENNDSELIDFISHSSWQGAHPFNTTILSSIIYTDPGEEEDEDSKSQLLMKSN